MSALTPRPPLAPICKRRRFASSAKTQTAFIDSPTSSSTTINQPIDLSIIPQLLEQTTLTNSLATDQVSFMVTRPTFSKCIYNLAGKTCTLPHIIARLDPHPPNESVHQERQISTLQFKDKMGLFLSFCSVLVSIQMFVPRGI